jgi:iron complex outermembrane recepter protein
MKSNSLYPYLLMVCICVSRFTMAADPHARLTGRVFLPNHEPAMYATIVLLNADSVIIKGAISEPDGTWLITQVAPGKYIIQVRNLGYLTYHTQPLKVISGQTITLDPIHLQAATGELHEVVVEADKAMVEVHADKLVFNVSSSANATGNNGLELLSKAPGVIVDLDNNIILQGKTGVQIYINGRPSRLSGQELTTMLEGMRSDNIQSIEIITNPSSRYDAEGSAGIINIVLRKSLHTGLNGNIVTSWTQGNFSRSSLGTTLNYNNDKVSVNAGITLSQINFQDNFQEASTQNGYSFEMLTRGLYTRSGYNITTGIGYTLNEKNTFNFDAQTFVSNRDQSIYNHTGISDLNLAMPYEILQAQTLAQTPAQNLVLNLNYRLLPTPSSSLSTDLSLGKYTSHAGTLQPNHYYDAGMQKLRSVNSRFRTDMAINLLSAKIDYENKIGILTFSTGAKWSRVSTDNDLTFFNLEGITEVINPHRSNEFTYSEDVGALFVLLNATPNQHLSFNAGLRVEHTSSLGFLKAALPNDLNKVPRQYTDLFPNLGITYNNQKNSIISATFGRRITRPNYHYLNPFEEKMSELMSWKGNPFLNPNYITNYQLTWSWQKKLVITNTYSITRDFFANIFVAESEKATVLTPRNMDRFTSNGLSISLPLQPLPWWEVSTFVNYNYDRYSGTMDEAVIQLNAHLYNLRMQNLLRMPMGIALELTYFVNSPWIFRGSIEVEGNHGLNAGLRKDFFNRKVLLQLTGNDIFHTSSWYYYTSNYGGITTDGVRMLDNQRFGFSLTYQMGTQKKPARRLRSGIEEEMRRIQE